MREAEIRQLQSAEVEGDHSCWVSLVTNSGKVPLTSGRSSGRSNKQKVVDRINAFIANPSQPSLEVRKKNWVGFIVGCFFFLIGLYVLVPEDWKITHFPGWLITTRFVRHPIEQGMEPMDFLGSYSKDQGLCVDYLTFMYAKYVLIPMGDWCGSVID